MLENSKSIYFIKKLFTFIDEKNKLEIIKYNKNTQNILDINLFNYKFFSKRYIVFEKTGKGKEYDWNCQLKFEGEYLNGEKWNGNGYNNNNIIYSLKDGKGLIKEYNWYGKLKFEGEYLNGERWNGKGKEFKNGKLIFEGEYINGKKIDSK